MSQRPINMRPHELEVFQACVVSEVQYGVRRFLVSDGRHRSAERLIERGLLERRTDGFVDLSGGDFLVVQITRLGRQAWNASLILAATTPEMCQQ